MLLTIFYIKTKYMNIRKELKNEKLNYFKEYEFIEILEKKT